MTGLCSSIAAEGQVLAGSLRPGADHHKWAHAQFADSYKLLVCRTLWTAAGQQRTTCHAAAEHTQTAAEASRAHMLDGALGQELTTSEALCRLATGRWKPFMACTLTPCPPSGGGLAPNE